MTEDAEERLDRLESLVERQAERIGDQQETIERQRERIGKLEEGRSPGDGDAVLPSTTRRSALKAGGLLALFGVGAGTASADPQGQVGTDDDPIETLHAAAIEGPLTDGVRLDSLVGEGLAVRDGTLTNVVDVPALTVSNVEVPVVNEADTFAVDVSVEETAGVQTEGLSVTVELSTGGGQVDERTVEASDVQGSQATVTVGDSSAFGTLDSGDYTATVTVDATNAQPATASESFTVMALFAGGDGRSENPYQIATWHHLDHVREVTDKALVLVGNLDPATEGYDAVASPSANGGNGFDPIGWDTAPFTGSFDGDGHVVEGLTISRPGRENVDVFGVTGSEALVEGVALVATDVTGSRYVGGVVGRNSGTVRESFATGSVSAGIQVGGLVGVNAGTVERSYATASANADPDTAGGLVGDNMGTIDQSYATGSVTVTVSAGVGGLVGDNTDTVTDSYWDTESTGQDSSAGGTGLTTDEMQGAEAADNMTGFDFQNVWATVDAGNDADVSADDYPVLRALDRAAQLEARA